MVGNAEGHGHDDIGGLATNTWKRDQFFARLRHLAAEIINQLLRQGNDILGLVAVKADGLDVIANRVFAKIEHLLRRIGSGKKRPCGLVDAGIGGLCRKRDRDHERKRV